MSRTAPRVVRRPRAALLGLGAWCLIGTTPQPQPSLTAQAESTRQGVKLALLGDAWPAGSTVRFEVRGRPAAPEPFDLGTVRIGSDGQLRATKRTPCTTRDSAAARGSVRITARAVEGQATADAVVPADAWVCLEGTAHAR